MTLVAYYPLNEDSGSTAYDASGNGNGLTINGATVGATGPLGTTGYSLDGTDDYLSGATFALDNTSGGVSFTAWLKPGFDTRQDEANHSPFRQKSGGSNNWGLSWSSAQLGSSVTGLAFEWSSSRIGYDFSTNYQGSWFFLAITASSSDPATGRIYVNGIKEKQADFGSGQTINATMDLEVGRWMDNTGDYFGGDMADVRFYDYALSPAEIQYLYDVATKGALTSDVRTS